MSSNKRVKIFLKKEDTLLNFMWADTASDGSVMMGIYGELFKSSVEKIFTEESELNPGVHYDVVDAEIPINNSKISFHASGRYKLTSKIKKSGIDRATIQGKPLDRIVNPTRMLEVLLPKNLQISKSKIREGRDFVIDISTFPCKLLRCTVLHASQYD